jgi:hypothetical protein
MCSYNEIKIEINLIKINTFRNNILYITTAENALI